ncbi:hypothetical protein NBRC116188_08790 [Oceaniserpentilla sp. 4NH20-0058]|uniref:hypothetical protein n=1 Tax=Oceaniserpentilla sp. 4NH20-0058 TaxID=3127660 RepID=UPI00310BA15B
MFFNQQRLKPLYLYFTFIFLNALSIAQAHGFISFLDREYVDVQSGSLLGLGHVSIGNKFEPNHSVLVGVGYVPKLSNHKELMLFSFRYRYDNPYVVNIKEMKLKPLSLGAGFLMANHDDLFLELPEQYPKGYYAPSALRIIFNYQATLEITPVIDVYLDVSILDVGLASYVREPDFFYDNYDYLGLEGITNWGFGVRYAF